MAIERRRDDFKGPKSLEAWIDVYERRAGDDVEFRLSPGEKIYYHPEYGFFTWYVCTEHKGRLSVPKMCGNGRELRRILYNFVKACAPLGIDEIMCCSRRHPDVYSKRILGGRCFKVEQSVNRNTGRREPMYYYIVSTRDYKGREYEE